MKNYKWMPILKTGKFTAKNGKLVTFEERDLDKIIANTDLSKEPQFVVEHPHYDKLGFGTISELKRIGKYLFALPKKVEEKFKNTVNAGELPGRSVSIDENTLALSHIGFLPKEIAPAVDGLGSYSFSIEPSAKNINLQLSLPEIENHFAAIEDDKYEFEKYEVSQWPFRNIKNIFRNLKNKWIEKFGKEEADELFPEWDIDETGNAPTIFEKAETGKPEVSQFSINTNGEKKMKIDLSKFDLSQIEPQLKAALEALQNENQQLVTDLSSTKAELQTATQTISSAQLEKNKNEVLAFCESPEMKLKILPAEKEKVVNLLLAAQEKGTLEFSAAENPTIKIQFNAFDFLKGTLKQLPDKIEMSEFATTRNAGDHSLTEYQKVGAEIAAFVNPKKQ
ncbi:MAG: hypothetical protein HYS25_00940 [Ignavibacteriales bacterium]|nr:hypothetical protein [Ignavibacteriales bacterium]